MKRFKEDRTTEKLLSFVLFFFPFFVGGFHLFVSCLFSIFLLIILFVVARFEKGLYIYRNDSLLAVTAFLLGLGVSSLWAVDRGMAILGLFHFFPVLPFGLLTMQCSAEKKDNVLESVPLSGICMTVLSFALRWIPSLRNYVSVNGRLSGFFQYPNTFAVFLLAGLIICIWNKRTLRIRIPCAFVLLFGILASGSRTVFILLIAVLIAVCVLRRDKQGFVLAGSILALGAVIILVYVVGIGDIRSVGRFLTTSLSESTLLGRILYYRDAFSVILRHPFGMGYLGYYYSHHSFQTGVYNVMFIHNELLQMLLDVGWVPAIVFSVAVAENIFSKSNSPCQRMILTVVSIHCMLDFDFQFIAVLCLFLFCMDFQKGRKKDIWFQKRMLALVSVPLSLLLLYFGIAQGLQLFGKNFAAVRVYPNFTAAQISAMNECTDLNQANQYAEQIIAHNTFVAEAYRVRAGYYYSLGDVDRFVENGYTALMLDPYNTDGYADFGMKLMAAAQQSKAAGNIEIEQYCNLALRKMQTLMEQTQQKTSALAWRIQDKPDFSLPEELTEYMQSFGGGQKNDD